MASRTDQACSTSVSVALRAVAVRVHLDLPGRSKIGQLLVGSVRLAAILACASAARAQTLRATLVQSGFVGPVGLCSPPGDLQRLFVVEQGGRIRIIVNGATLATPFLDLGSSGLNKISFSPGGERGLLGLAFHPNYAANGYFYVDYTQIGTGSIVVERYQASANPDLAESTSGLTLSSAAHPGSLHNGGCLQFGLDGKLYISIGDGSGDPQSGSTLGGKILRLDVDLPPPHVPPDNPFYGSTSTLPEIWHLGLRNPWRFSFDRASGDLWLADVGAGAFEEIDFAAAGVGGLNFGWPCMEAAQCTVSTACVCNDPALTLPIYAYSQFGPPCAIIGGYVYRGGNLPALQGAYFFGDHCSSQIWSLQYSGGQVTNLVDRTLELEPDGAPTISSINSFGEDAVGELYICEYFGSIYRIDPFCSLLDCNGNGIGDVCDLQSGAALDCNLNAVPDACDIASGLESDCNGNGVPDACDLGSGVSLDINGNGVPDECDCPGGALPVIHCTAKINSLFCIPALTFTGVPSASGATSFTVSADAVLNNESGLLFYGYQSAALAFQGGTLCVRPPLRRTPAQDSGGHATGHDCSGVLSFDFGARIASGVDPALQAGQSFSCQFWSLDPQDAFHSSLTDALRASICP